MSRIDSLALSNSATTTKQVTDEQNAMLDELEVLRQEALAGVQRYNVKCEEYVAKHGEAVGAIANTRDIATELHKAHVNEPLPELIPEPTVKPAPSNARRRR